MDWNISLLLATVDIEGFTPCCDGGTEHDRPFRVPQMKDTSKLLKSLNVDYCPRLSPFLFKDVRVTAISLLMLSS